MKLRLTVFIFVLLSIIIVVPQVAMASWIRFSSQELIQESDVILLGDIVGPVGEEERKSQGLPASWVTYWEVKVYYYLKGNQESKKFIVGTPGAKNKSTMTSIDYRLDQWGNMVLLFLRQREGLYEPLSPQGVVNLKKNEYSQKKDEPLNGQLILKEFDIADPKISQQEKSELEKFILIHTNVPQAQPFNSKRFTTEEAIILFLVLLVFVAAGIAFARRRLKGE